MSRYTVRHNISGLGTRPDVAPAVDRTGGWSPALWLGAPAPGGLALPPAKPSMAWMYSPRGVFLGERQLVVADSGNHRVPMWCWASRTARPRVTGRAGADPSGA
jgi:hypothetical protein